MRILIVLIRVLAGLLILVTGLSLFESNEWWIRIWDFPRVQILAGLVLAAGLSLWLDRRAGRGIAVLCAVAAGWQLYRIYPYTPLARTELAFADNVPGAKGACFSVLSLNVLESNRDYPRTARLIDRMRPDILLLMETDRRWADALATQLARYPHRLERPIENTYGMILATRLPMRDGRIETIAEKDTPSIHAELTAGSAFRVIALHPRPPSPDRIPRPAMRRSRSPQSARRVPGCPSSRSATSTMSPGRIRRSSSNGSGGISMRGSVAVRLQPSPPVRLCSAGRSITCSSPPTSRFATSRSSRMSVRIICRSIRVSA
ncbi:hypothetical protein QP165_03385 [Sphingomonas sp. 22R3R2A-7]